jgi:hypothetical protein
MRCGDKARRAPTASVAFQQLKQQAAKVGGSDDAELSPFRRCAEPSETNKRFPSH